MKFLILAFLVLAGLVGHLANADQPELDKPNVLFISLDDLNDWVGCYGGHPNAHTPHIDALAARGCLFTNAYCVSPICGPSRAAVLTGMRPETTGVYHNRGKYHDYVPHAVTFPEHFRANGYRAMAAGKVNHDLGEPDPKLWDENGPTCGVLGTPFNGDELDTATMKPTRTINRGRLKITLPANGGLSAIDRPSNKWDSFDWAPLDVPASEFPDGKIADWATRKLATEQVQPFLLAVGFYKPHQPFFAPREYFDLHPLGTICLPETYRCDLSDVPKPGRDLALRPWTSGTHLTVVKHQAWQQAVQGYLATVSFVDDLVGQVVSSLDAGPHANNTWIVLWSDHGWSLGEKEHWGKHTAWRECTRVPLIIVPPKNRQAEYRAGRKCEVPVSLLDLYPTLIEMCRLPRRDEVEGRSLLPLLSSANSKQPEKMVVTTIGRGSHAINHGRYTYIHYFDGSEEFYDRKSDPRQYLNLAGRINSVEADRFRKALPMDAKIRQFVRVGNLKIVYPSDGDPMCFDFGSTFGISEQTDVADLHQELINKVTSHLSEHGITSRNVVISKSKLK